MWYKCHTNDLFYARGVDIRGTLESWGNESPPQGIPIWIQNKNLLSVLLKYNKKQLSLSGKVQTHDTINDKTGESGLSVKNFLSLDFNDL